MTAQPTYPFGPAVEHLKTEGTVTRLDWPPGNFLAIRSVTETTLMTLPYIFITTGAGKRQPWFANSEDMLAEDWILL